MKITVSAGHNPKGMVACGAVGLIDESTENRIITDKVVEILKQQGHDVKCCTCNNGTSVADVLNKIISSSNAHSKADLHVSIHFNSGANDKSGNGKTTGVEVLTTGTLKQADIIADRVCAKLSEVGFRNRGRKTRTDLSFLNRTVGNAILIEVCFVDDKDDVSLYNSNKDVIARKICEGILGTNLGPPKPTVSDSNTLYRVCVGSYSVRSNADKLVEELKAKGYSPFITTVTK